MAKGTEVQKLLEVRVNAAGTWRERECTLTGEVSQAVSERTLRGNFRTRADSITGNGTKRNGGRKKFNVNFIVMISVFFV